MGARPRARRRRGLPVPALRANDSIPYDLVHPVAPHRSSRFNRYELKYLVGIEELPALRDDIAARLDPDPLYPDGRYPVWSLYYDSIGLRCYWEKIDGQRFRRKLRIRHYGDPWSVGDTEPVWIEIKQRIDRTTQKRRILLPYADALALGRGEVPDGLRERDHAVAEEIATMVFRQGLVPMAMVGYQRQAFEGGPYDDGVRVTFDVRVRGRDRDLHFGGDVTGDRNVVDPSLVVVEVKADARVPRWLTAVVANHRLSIVRMSKYCRTIDAFAGAPRALYHRSDDIQEAVP